MIVTVSGIILKEYTVGESDKFITLFTKEYGKIQAGAPSAKKFHKGFASGTELFVYAEFTLTHFKGHYKLVAVEPIHTFHPIREDLYRLSYATYIAEFMSQVLMENAENQGLFGLMLYTLHNLERSKEGQLERIRRTFELRALSFLGFKPQIDYCVIGHEAIVDDTQTTYLLDVEEGGLVCPHCRSNAFTIPLSYSSLYTLRYILKASLKQLYAFEVKDYVLKELGALSDAMIQYYIDAYFKSLDFIKGLEKL